MTMVTFENMDNKTTSVNETLLELNFRYAQGLIPFLVTLALFCAIGLVGNILIIWVVSTGRDYRKTNFKVFAIALASVDLFTCLTVIPAEILKSRYYYNYPDNVLCKSKCAVQLFSMTAAALILLVICIDRYRVTCRQFQCRQIRPKLAKYIICTVLLLAMFLSIPAGILCGTAESLKLNEQGQNITIYVCEKDKRYEFSVFRILYKYGMSGVLTIVAVTFIVLYIMILRKIYRHWKRPAGGSVRMDDLVRTGSTASSVFTSQQVSDLSPDDVFTSSDNESNTKCNKQAVVNKNSLTNNESDTHDIRHAVFSNISTIDNEINRTDSKDAEDTKNTPSGNDIIPHSSRCAVSNRTKERRQNSRLESAFSKKRSLHSVTSIGSLGFRWISRHRRSSTPTGKISKKTVIWFILTLLFVLTYIVYATLSFVKQSVLYTLSPGLMCVYHIFSRIHLVNNCINVFVYMILDKKFLPNCKRLFKRQTSK